jgi:phosphonoacetaldehyde hydrolase
VLKAVIFDWAGTVVDFGSRAPVLAFVRTFQEFGITLSEEEARGPMGLAKREHIQALGHLPRVAAEWARVHGHAFGESDTDQLYAAFGALSLAVVTEHADLVPGVEGVLASLRGRGLKIGSTTGYARSIMTRLAPVAAGNGFAPDCLVCPDDVAAGRPSPLMMYRCFVELGVWPAAACVKVDDTAPGLAEGLAAGAWTVGVALSGNALGYSREQLAALGGPRLTEARARAYAELTTAGAHVVIDSVADLLPVLDDFATRLECGERPCCRPTP